MNEEKLKVMRQILAQVEEELEFALDTDEGSKITKRIEHNGREYEIQMTREECLEDSLIEISKLLESINFGLH
ncbi:hypothetical protein LZU21_06830 [Staphylococcus epidermidis]|uniref:hypothetical protein n=1 Tax=Staphylococcus epidermidis TaxID=1282 RepID=UPI0020956EBF|nr:hypothetical protein [Staphylococcus epidermidis]MCO6345059.1 hypothetical protein [Staphylococcus epidermidis]